MCVSVARAAKHQEDVVLENFIGRAASAAMSTFGLWVRDTLKAEAVKNLAEKTLQMSVATAIETGVKTSLTKAAQAVLPGLALAVITDTFFDHAGIQNRTTRQVAAVVAGVLGIALSTAVTLSSAGIAPGVAYVIAEAGVQYCGYRAVHAAASAICNA